MFHLITGGSGSGKSAYAEERIVAYHKQNVLYYIATMQPYGKEMEEKIKRHRKMREGKGFQTIECYTDLKEQHVEKGSSVLLECMSNLVANECYRALEEMDEERIIMSICEGVTHLRNQCDNLVVVTNEVCSECTTDSVDMIRYKKILSRINCAMAREADRVTEVVYGIPVEVGV